LKQRCAATFAGDISDPATAETIGLQYEFDTIFHLAGILSSGGERTPLLAHHVNVTGTANILELARRQTEKGGAPVKVIFTSTIAVYGIPSVEDKRKAGAVNEEQFLTPITMYGANKLYCENLGRYYAEHFGMLSGDPRRPHVDFRCVRYPGILNAFSLPTGGTSDYAPEMVHRLAQGMSYSCFVREDTKIPFLMMPDAVRAVVELGSAPRERLSRRVYNVGGFSPSAKDIASLVESHFPDSKVTFNPHEQRQHIVDSWPESVDDSPAQNDWHWKPHFGFRDGFEKYLVPSVMAQYRKASAVGQL
jgi:nucleoside-diphosphate-sugar epimerase